MLQHRTDILRHFLSLPGFYYWNCTIILTLFLKEINCFVSCSHRPSSATTAAPPKIYSSFLRKKPFKLFSSKLIELGTNWAKDRSRNWPKLTLMNPPCNHKPRLGERGKCEALSFFPLSLFSLSFHLKQTCRAYKYFPASNKKNPSKHFCWKQYKESDTIYHAFQ